MVRRIPILWLSVAILVAVFALRLSAAETPPTYDDPRPGRFMRSWLVLGPLSVADGEAAPDEETQRKAFDGDLLKKAGGEAEIEPRAGETLKIGDEDAAWRLIESDADVVDLDESLGRPSHSVAYAAARINAPEERKHLLAIGSDDGVKVWLNGELIHENWVGRPVTPDEDLVAVQLRKGTNRLLLKVQNQQQGWGFACRLLGADQTAKALVRAAAAGDLEKVKLLVDGGADPSRRGAIRLAPLHAARIRGYGQIVEYLVSAGADADAAPPTLEEFISARMGEVIEGDSPGVSVLVAQDGDVLFQGGYGLASIEHQAPVTTKTKFRIGSVSKQFTAAAILKLQEASKLSVDDTLDKFISDYPRGDEVTIHHLLTHTSGIHSFTSKPGFLGTVATFVEPEAHIESFKNDDYDFDPGTKWSYNNSGYFLLGYIVSQVSGQSLGEYLKAEFFEPLGMHDTGVHHWADVLPHEATGYAMEEGHVTKALDWDMSQAGGAGALYSTVEDLHRWNEGIFGGKLLSPETLEAAFTPVQLPEDAAGLPYGYGWVIGELRGLKEIQHGGGLHGFVSHLARYPEHDVTVAVLVNASPPPEGLSPGSISQEIAEFVLWEEMKPREVLVADKDADPKEYEAYVGRYDYGGPVLTVTREGDRLLAQLTGQPKFEIFPRGEDEFFWKVVDAQVKFERDENGDVVRAIHRQNGQTIRAARLEDIEQIELGPDVLEQYVGRYDYGGGRAIMTITRDGDRLFAQLTGQPKLEIFAKAEDKFFWKAVAAQVTFKKDDDGKVVEAVHEQGGQTIKAPRVE